MTLKNEQTPTSSWRTLGALTIAAVGIEVGCGAERKADKNDGTAYSENLSDEARDAFLGTLEDAWPEVVALQVAETQDAFDGLKEAIVALVADSQDAATRSTAQDAWMTAMDAWQKLELMKIGSAGDSLKVIGGQDLAYEIYSWPTTNRCLVDQRTVRGEYAADSFFNDEDIKENSYGLDALEVLLFSPTDSHDCPSQVITSSTWSSLGEDGIAQARADYSLRVVNQVIDELERIESDWESGFADELAQAGANGSIFETDLAGLNTIFDSLFYLELQVKDDKLGWPLGLTPCGLDDCSGKVESPISGSSHLWVASNLVGFRSLFTGNDGLGMYDYLGSLGDEGGALADEVIAKLDTADSALADLAHPLDEATTADLSGLEAAHAAVKGVTDLLKNDFPVVIEGLKVPQEASGDTD